MQINITKMGDGYVVTDNDEEQRVFLLMQEKEMLLYLANYMFSCFKVDKDIVQAEIKIKRVTRTKENANPIFPKPLDLPF